MSLARRDAELRELMDDPDCDPHRLRRTLERFDAVNRLVSCWGRVYRDRVRPVLTGLGRPARILDIGCGAGDVLARLAHRARREGFEVEATGIDPDPRALDVARGREGTGVTFRQAYSRELVDAGERFDIVLSNHLLHHLDEAQLGGLLADSEALASALCLHSDIARSREAYLGFALGIAPLSTGTLLRVDGLRSIRRSYTPAELGERLPAGWHVERPGRFRLLAVREHTVRSAHAG